MLGSTRGVAVLGSLFGLAGCSSVDCPAIAVSCGDGLTIALHTEGGSWSPGAYELAIQSPTASWLCTFREPSDFPASEGLPQVVPCSDGAIGSIAKVPCPETDGGPDAGCYSVSFFISVTSAGLEISVRIDGRAVADESLSPAYRAFTPSPGAECGAPTCRVAQTDLTIPSD